VWAALERGSGRESFPGPPWVERLKHYANEQTQVYLGFDLPSVIIVRQSKKFLSINATYTVSQLSQFSRFLFFMYIVLPCLVK